jgi:hypothetical protein
VKYILYSFPNEPMIAALALYKSLHGMHSCINTSLYLQPARPPQSFHNPSAPTGSQQKVRRVTPQLCSVTTPLFSKKDITVLANIRNGIKTLFIYIINLSLNACFSLLHYLNLLNNI